MNWKPLSKINNKELILWVCELSEKAVGKKNVYVATEDLRIDKFVKKSGYQSILSSKNALTGTDRVAEAALEMAPVLAAAEVIM